MKICVFGASSRELAQGYYDAAFELGAELARRGHELVFGGGTSGLMAPPPAASPVWAGVSPAWPPAFSTSRAYSMRAARR